MRTFGELLAEAEEENDPDISRKSEQDILKSPAGKYMVDDAGERMLSDDGNIDGVDNVPTDVEDEFYDDSTPDPVQPELSDEEPVPEEDGSEEATPEDGATPAPEDDEVKSSGDAPTDGSTTPEDDTVTQKTFKDFFNTESPEAGKYVTESMIKAKAGNEVTAISQMIQSLSNDSGESPIADALDDSIVTWVSQEIQNGIGVLKDEVEHAGEDGLTADTLRNTLESASKIIQAQMENDTTFDNVSDKSVLEWLGKFKEFITEMFSIPTAGDGDFSWEELADFSSVAMATAKALSGAQDGGMDFIEKELTTAIKKLAETVK